MGACRQMRSLRRIISEMRHSRYIICIFALFIIITYDWATLIQRLVSVPYSQFQYPLEINLRKLVAEAEANGGNVPAWAPAPINDGVFPVLHLNEHRCRKRKSYKLLILVKSSVVNSKFRAVLRATWTNQRYYDSTYFPVQFVFVLGAATTQKEQEAVNEEQNKYKDIIQQGFRDNYYNNTLKLMFAIDWAVHYCANADSVLFADDDYYISPINLSNLLQNRNPNKSWVIGYVFYNPVPKRTPFSKWYTSLSEYPFSFWPPYPTGGAFVASLKLCRKVSIAQRFVKYLRFDDVFFGIVLKKLRVWPEHHDLFYFTQPLPVARWMYANTIAVHLDHNIDQLLIIWKIMNYTAV